MSQQKTNALRTILVAGSIAGVLDLTAACVYSWLRAGVTPIRVFHSVASGLVGENAARGGWKTAALGIALHFLIATIWATIFYAASRIFKLLVNHPIPSGLFYGLVVYLLMNFVVLPLSAVPRRPVPPPLSARVYGALIIMFFVGLPIAFTVRRFAR